MRTVFLVLFCSSLGFSAEVPWRITRVVRQGLPPYEEPGESERLYRLEGLPAKPKVGQRMVLKRAQSTLNPGTLEVLRIEADHLLAKLVQRGDTYPLKGDSVWLEGVATAKPASGKGSVSPTVPSKVTAIKPSPVKAAPVKAPPPTRLFTDTIFFLKGQAALSPGGQQKLKTWVQRTDKAARWTLTAGPFPGEVASLNGSRTRAIAEELRRLGVEQVVEEAAAGPVSKEKPAVEVKVEVPGR